MKMQKRGMVFLLAAAVLLFSMGGIFSLTQWEGIIAQAEDSTDGGSSTSSYANHLFYDYDYKNPVVSTSVPSVTEGTTTDTTTSTVTIYGNGAALKAGETVLYSKQFIAYTDVLASYDYRTDDKGKVKTLTCKVIAGVTTSDVAPSINGKLVNGKIVDKEAAEIAKATIKNGQVTVTATGKKAGTVYLWVVDTGRNGTMGCCKIDVKLAPKKLEVWSMQTGTKLSSKAQIIDGENLLVQIKGIVSKDLEADSSCTYTCQIDSQYQNYVSVKPTEDNSLFTLTASGLKDGGAVKVPITFICDQSGKKVKVSVTVKPASTVPAS